MAPHTKIATPPDVVEVFDLAYRSRDFSAGVDCIEGRLVGVALVHRDLVGIDVRSHGFVEEALRRQQEVYVHALLGDSAVEVFPEALDLDVRLVNAPPAAVGAFAFARHFLDEGQAPYCPPVDQRMVDRRAALFNHLFALPVAQRVGPLPANADQNNVDRKAHPFKVEHIDWFRIQAPQFT